MLEGEPNDKKYQKKIIDNLVYMVYIYDDTIVVYLNMHGGKDIETISLADTDKAIEDGLRVQTQSSMVHQQSWAVYAPSGKSLLFREGFLI